MLCENQKCTKKSGDYPCKNCLSKFCSNSCMIDHFFILHANDKKGKENKIINNSKMKPERSVNNRYVKQGVFLKEIKYESYFDFDNFEKVKIGKKIQMLGSGSFGEVYLIKNKLDSRLFAVKSMEKKKILDTGNKLDLIRREIDIHSRLVHENIVRLFSSHEDSLNFYLIMEYVNSGSLFSLIKKKKRLDEEEAFKYFIQTASAIFFLHDNNLIHRDIKPENLLIEENGNLKLCDFGWCIGSEIGNRMTFCGTIEYMAPEIIKETPYDASIDVWSFGVLLYELLHGFSPFRAKGDEEEYTEIFRNIIKHSYIIEREDISSQSKDLINKLLSRDNSSRLKIKEIFDHPWVKMFTKLDDNIIGNYILPKKESYKNSEADSPYIDKYNLRLVKENLGQPPTDKEKIKENLLLQRNNTIKAAMNCTNDFSNNDQGDNLFDRVLTQVKERNKDRRKKSRILNDSANFNLDKILTEDNKIIIRMKKEESNQILMEQIQPKRDVDSFKLMNEINEIEFDLDKQSVDHEKKNYSSKSNLIYKDFKTKFSLLDTKRDTNETSEASISFNKNSLSSNSKLINLHPQYYKEESNSDLKEVNYKQPVEKKSISIKDFNDGRQSKGFKVRTSKYQNRSEVRDVNKELDLSFLPKDLAYRNESFNDSNKSLQNAIELLEKAKDNKKDIDVEEKKENSFWDKVGNFLNPFKCG